MFRALPYKTKQLFYILIKLSIVGGAFSFIYQRIANNQNLDFDVFWSFLIENDVFSLKNIVFLLILTLFNWFFEIAKWQNLVLVIKNISFYDALKQSLAALTASLFTPHRIGDYAAKLLYYPRTVRKQILLLNLVSHMAQMSVTLIFGIIGLLFFINRYSLDVSYYRMARLVALILLIMLISGFGITSKRIKIKGFSLTRIIAFIKGIPGIIMFKNFLFSIARYLIFSFQFYLLLCIFKVDVNYINAMVVITTMYLISSIIPSIFLFDVVIKGSVALYLFNIVGVNDLTVLTIILLMWILNFVLPSIVGSFYVLNYNHHQPKEVINK
jgi:hypothetical protein